MCYLSITSCGVLLSKMDSFLFVPSKLFLLDAFSSSRKTFHQFCLKKKNRSMGSLTYLALTLSLNNIISLTRSLSLSSLSLYLWTLNRHTLSLVQAHTLPCSFFSHACFNDLPLYVDNISSFFEATSFVRLFWVLLTLWKIQSNHFWSCHVWA